MKRRLMKLTAMLLAFAMIFGTDASMIAAAPAIEEASMPEEEPAAETDANEDVEAPGENDLADDDAEAPDGKAVADETDETSDDKSAVSPEANSEETPDEDVIEAPDDENDSFFYRELSDEEEEAKEDAAADEEQVMEAAEGEDYAEGEVIALCDTEEEAEKIAEGYAKSTGYTVTVESFRYGVALLKISGRPSTDKLMENAGTASLDSVETFVKLSADTSNNLPAVYPNYYREAYSVNDTSNEEEFRDPMLQVHSEQYEGMYQWYHNKVNDKYVWDKIDKSGSSLKTNLQQIHVAVLDTGINYEHADFGTVTHQNFVSEKNESGQTAYEKGGGDTDGHGTNVAGIIANTANNNIGGRGVAAGVVLDSYRVLNRDGSGSDEDILAGLKKAVQDKGSKNIKVINMSLGSSFYNGAYVDPFLEARDKGILVIAAAGNENNSAYHYPAAYEGVMSVAALNSDYEKSSFSNYGDWVDIAAPGGERRVDMNDPTFSDSQPLWASGMKDANSDIRTVNGQNYEGMNGTSQATPVIAGCAAILFASNTSSTPEKVEARLKETARPLKSRYALGAGCVDIAAAISIDTAVPAPEASVESGVIPSGQNVAFNLPDGYEYADYAVIYYTLNGKKPLDPSTKAEDVRTCKPGASIKLEGAGSVTICMQTLIFGSESSVSEYKYSFEDSQVEKIVVTVPGNITVTALKGQASTVVPAITDAEIAIDKTVAFTAEVLPSYAKNKKLTWTSSNPEFATVDASGKVKGICEGSTKITVSSADGGTVAVIPVDVKKIPDQIQITKESINLTVGGTETYKFNEGEIKVFPEEASQHFVLKSLNDKVAVIKLDANGKQYIEAVAPGETTVTATTADGSNLSDSVIVNVGSKVKKIEISGPSGQNYATKGISFTPTVVLNDGNSITEGSSGVKWEVVSPSDVGNNFVDNLDGSLLIKQGYGSGASKEIKLQAKCGTVSSNVLTLTLYDQTTSITYSDFATQFIWGDYAFLKDTSLDLSSMFKVYPASANPKLKFTITNNAAKLNPENGYALLNKEGWVYVKAEAIDGSGRSYTLSFYVMGAGGEFAGLKYKSANPVIYPGRSLDVETIFVNGAGSLSSVTQFMIYNENDKEYYSELDGLKISGKKITGTNALKDTTKGKRHEIALLQYNWWYNRWYTIATVGVESYPAGTKNICLDFNSDPRAEDKTFYMKPGDSWRLKASSEPENACQKYYTFKSSNTKAVTVDEAGMVKAVGNGKTTVTVTAGDGSNKTAKLYIEVAKKPESLEISSKTGEFKAVPGKSINLIATVKPDDAVNKDVTWWLTNNDPQATLSQNGTLKINNDVHSGSVFVSAEAKANPKAKATVQIEFRPETKSIDLVEDQVKKKGVTVFTQNIGTCKTTASFSAEVRSKQAGQRPFDPTVASSNSNVSVVEAGNTAIPYPPKYTYTVTANGTKAENATITIAATDGSNKKATVKVTVLVPVTELSLKAKDGIATVTPGKSITLVAETNKDASNKKVKWSFESDEKEAELKAVGIDTEQFKKSGKISMAKTSTLNSTFKVRATAEDGSGTYKELTVTAKPAAVTAVTITGDDNKQVKETRLGFFRNGYNDTGRDSSDPFCISRFFKIDFSGTGDYQNVPIVTSSDERIVRAEFVNRKDGADGSWLKVYTYEYNKFQATKTGKATVTVKSADGSNKSAKISVSVEEPVRSISISADQSGRCIAANGKIKMRAAVPETASNKKVNWRLEYNSGLEVQKDVATISASGDLKPNSKLQNPVEIKVVATPADGATYYQRVTPQQFVSVSASETITLYPAQGAIVFLHNNAPSKNLTQKVGDELVLDVAPDLSYNLVPYRDYLVTYQTGPIKVSYTKKAADGTTIKIKCLKAGTSTITAAARDGSGKKATFKVTVKKR